MNLRLKLLLPADSMINNTDNLVTFTLVTADSMINNTDNLVTFTLVTALRV